MPIDFHIEKKFLQAQILLYGQNRNILNDHELLSGTISGVYDRSLQSLKNNNEDVFENAYKMLDNFTIHVL